MNREFYGGRGLTLITDQVVYNFSSLETATPSKNSVYSYLAEASFKQTEAKEISIWMKGFLNPKRSSFYEFSLDSNAESKLFISTDQTSLNKKLIASSNPNTKNQVYLQEGDFYYIESVASKASGGLNLAINARMFTTTLTDQVSAFVNNEIQDIEIESSIILESYVILNFF